MVTRAVRERLAQDIGGWLTDGLISPEAHALLAQRYEARTFGVGQAVKYLGISGGLLVFFGLLGLAAASSHSTVVPPFVLLATGAGLTWAGIWLAGNELGRHGISSKIALALGLVAGALGVVVAVHALDVSDEKTPTAAAAVVLPVVGLLAYRYRNVFVLILGLVGFFCWVGTAGVFGRSHHDPFDADPILMGGAAVLVLATGVYHELVLRRQTGPFFLAYEAAGLLCLNAALFVLSIDGYSHWELLPERLHWILLFALAGVGQVIAGARLQNGLFTAFGVTALGVLAASRYVHHFWRQAHEGVFFLVGGVVLFSAGMGCELLLERIRGRTS